MEDDPESGVASAEGHQAGQLRIPRMQGTVRTVAGCCEGRHEALEDPHLDTGCGQDQRRDEGGGLAVEAAAGWDGARQTYEWYARPVQPAREVS